MKFRVRTADGSTIFDGSYKIDNNGVLTIIPEDNSKPKLLLSPGYWHEVSESRTSSIGGRYAF